MQHPTDDLRIKWTRVLLPPAFLQEEFPLSVIASNTVFETREQIRRILTGQDDRLLVVVGPCSIHDPKAAREYAVRLRSLMAQLGHALCLVMRVYFEKPRTTVGWKGLINDPFLNGTSKINEGLRLARHLLLDLAELGVPAGTEFLDLVTPQYLADLVSWGAIGARTTESQAHRELASGLSCPVGFKNGTSGNLQIAIDALKAAAHSHTFLSVTKQGQSAIFATTGNPDCHLILRGGRGTVNYTPEGVAQAVAQLEAADLKPRVMVDCSHANSNKDHTRQSVVFQSVLEQVSGQEHHILGLMLESHLVAGRQDVIPGQLLSYGQSITDACIGWEETAILLKELAQAVEMRRQRQ
ncbi:3-deoxy-7-phosphoheptulonate synthase [Anthocerotibacter panamensis]|uniref:3-deoxy-7-phosphoheptulonate synthase n=1 Tax=Anthocerotibacter panamensis TaxID=2857077 RepID=UPI001C4060ED